MSPGGRAQKDESDVADPIVQLYARLDSWEEYQSLVAERHRLEGDPQRAEDELPDREWINGEIDRLNAELRATDPADMDRITALNERIRQLRELLRSLG